MLPPTLSCEVRCRRTPRSWNRRARARWTIVAPTWDLMSSPMIGSPAFRKRWFQYSSRAMNTGMQVLEAGCAFVNCIPAFSAREEHWNQRFRKAGLPIIGDDIKSQVGATIVHRALARLFHD